MSSKKNVWAIIGAGNGGQTMAGHLGIMGEKVRIYDVSTDTVAQLNETKTIQLHHAIEGCGKIEFATVDIEEAINGADNIVIVLPSIYHEAIAYKIVPYLKDGQVILIHPETCCGAIAFRQIMKKNDCKAKVVVGCASNLIYATRIIKNGEVYVYGLKRSVTVAALPATDNEKLLSAIAGVFPMFTLVDHVLKISLDNTNAMVHPGPAILNTGRIEARPAIPFQYYREGFTPGVGRLVHALDEERRAIAREFGFIQRTINESYIAQYNHGSNDMSIDELISGVQDYEGIMAPDRMDVRYIYEDIPYNLVPTAALGDIAGVDTPCMDALITIGRTIVKEKPDIGRTLESMGLIGVDKKEFLSYVMGEK